MAVPLPAPAARTIEQLVADVRADLDAAAAGPRSAVRWVRLDGLHLTLRFLGPTPEERVDLVAAAVDAAAAVGRPVEVTVAGAGAFPSPNRPRTLWLRVAGGADGLEALAREVDRQLAPAGWSADGRPFRPHLTLARADGRREGPLAASRLAARAAGLELHFAVDRLVLFESVTGDGPARYVPRREAELRG